MLESMLAEAEAEVAASGPVQRLTDEQILALMQTTLPPSMSADIDAETGGLE